MRTTVYVPDDLLAAVRAEHPDVNVSGVLQAALRALTGCAHDRVVCDGCGRAMLRRELDAAAVEQFWALLERHLEIAVRNGVSAQAAARAVRNAATAAGVVRAVTAPQIRPTRAERAAWSA